MHLYICEYLSATVPRCPQGDPGSSSGREQPPESGTTWRPPVSHPGLDVFGKEGHSTQICVLCDHSPNLLALELPRPLFSDSGRSCDTLKPLLGAQEGPAWMCSPCPAWAGQLSQHLCQREWEGCWLWAKLWQKYFQ